MRGICQGAVSPSPGLSIARVNSLVASLSRSRLRADRRVYSAWSAQAPHLWIPVCAGMTAGDGSLPDSSPQPLIGESIEPAAHLELILTGLYAKTGNGLILQLQICGERFQAAFVMAEPGYCLVPVSTGTTAVLIHPSLGLLPAGRASRTSGTVRGISISSKLEHPPFLPECFNDAWIARPVPDQRQVGVGQHRRDVPVPASICALRTGPVPPGTLASSNHSYGPPGSGHPHQFIQGRTLWAEADVIGQVARGLAMLRLASSPHPAPSMAFIFTSAQSIVRPLGPCSPAASPDPILATPGRRPPLPAVIPGPSRPIVVPANTWGSSHAPGDGLPETL